MRSARFGGDELNLGLLLDLLKLLPGPSFSVAANTVGASGAATTPSGCGAGTAAASLRGTHPGANAPGNAPGGASGGAAREAPPVTLVFFLGGCTYAEIAALRWLSRNGVPRREYIVATTHICTGDTLLESLSEACDNQLEQIGDL